MVSLVFFEDEDGVFWCWKDFLTSCRVDKWSDLGDPLVLENQTVQIIEEIREFLKKGSVFISRIIYFSSVQSLNRVQLFATPWTAECQAFLSITNSQSLCKLMSIESVRPSSHLIFCRPLPLLPLIPPSIGVFQMSQFFASGGQSIGISASASVLPMNTQGWVPLGLAGLMSLQFKGLPRVSSNTTVQKH